MSNSKISVKGGISDFSKQSKNEVKKKTSNFFLTINTNQSYKDGDSNIEADTEYFDGTISNMLNHINEYINLPDGDTFENDVINADVDYMIELGTKQRALHAHIFLKFVHNSNLKLDFKKMKQYVCQELGLPNLFFSNRVVRGGNQSVLDYLNKYSK